MAPGSEPGRVTRPYWAYWYTNTVSAIAVAEPR
jgi:hypothetical protein